ncbi:MAG: 2Fe-2S iron-sulfur cluster-binding protein [Halobacteria archaeon]|nr:2Fe-2S iron-sulfur cluster-binding protein [Halobacteria archaeon]
MAGNETVDRYLIELVREDGEQETVEAKTDETVLEAAEGDGIGLPFGCRRGTCSTCTGKLIEGGVEHRRPPRALKEKHLEEGYVLLCIAEPRTDSRIEVGTDVQKRLVTNPWKSRN